MSLGTMERFCLGTAVLVLAAFGCSEGSSNDDETGGAENAGGAASGGAANGGTDNSGGTAGGQNNGGSTESTGGEAGSAATSETVLFGFDEDLEGFGFDVYYNADYPNLADMDEAEDVEQPADGLDAVWTEDAGSDGNPGAVKITAPFSAWDQTVNIQTDYTDQPDMTGRTLRARVQILSDGGFVNTDGAAGGAFIYVKTGEGDSWIFGRGIWTSLEADDYGSWVDLEFELENPDYYDEGYDFTLVRSIGVQVGTGTYTGEETTLPTTATILVDQITIE